MEAAEERTVMSLMKNVIEYTDDEILLFYQPMWISGYYVGGIFKEDVVIRHVFHIDRDNVLTSYDEACDNEYFVCKIGYFDDNQYVIPVGVLSDKYSLKMDPDSTLEYSDFVTPEGGRPINEILKLIGSDVIIGNGDGKIPKDLILDAKKHYPTKAELQHYVDLRISSVLSSELELEKDYDQKYKKFIENKLSGIKQPGITDLSEIELRKYVLIYSKLSDMLDNSGAYSETDWQKKIADILCLIFPQYIFVTRETDIGKINGHRKEVDFLLIDNSGYVDVLEIKVPNTQLLGLRTVRNNYVPAKQVSDTATQLEYYLYCLNRYAENNLEKMLSDKFKDELPKGLTVKILNPRGYIIMGRTKDFNNEQISTLEIIRRQYSHIIDLITYDDLLERLQNTIEQLKKKGGSPE